MPVLRISRALAALSSLFMLAACGGDDDTGGGMQQGSGGAPVGMATGTGGSAAPATSGTGGTTPTMTMTMTGTGGMSGGTMMTGTGGMSGTMMTGTGGTTMPGTGGMGTTMMGLAGMGMAPMGGGDISSCPKPPASASMEAIAALNAVNTLRLASGSGCATMAEALNTSAQKHCEYYAANAMDDMCVADPHSEVMSCMSFYGASPGDRMKKAGYMFGASEVMAFQDDAAAAVAQWINSVWHRIPLLDPWTTELGYGHAAMCDTIDLGRGTPMPDDTVVVYPYNGQTDVPTEFNGMYEGPEPPKPPTGWPSAAPINVYAKNMMITDHVLTLDGDTTPIEHVWLTATESNFLRNGVMMYANMPFTAMTKYHVRVKGSYVGGDLDLEWTFTTGAAPTWPRR
jgi:hypothetical protein